MPTRRPTRRRRRDRRPPGRLRAEPLADRTVPSGNPAALDDSFATLPGGTLAVPPAGVLANDSDPDGLALSAVLTEGPSRGSLTLNSDGSFVYTPGPGFIGTDEFRYEASSGNGTSNKAHVFISVGATTSAPAASPDAYSAAGPLAVAAATGVLANDTAPDGGALTAVLVGGPADGILILNPDGSFIFTPSPLFVGTDTFTYQARDATGALSVVTTVTIDVGVGNQPPVAADDSATATEEMPLDGPSVLANDADPDGDTVVAQLATAPAHGQLTLRADGTFTYIPDPDYSGPDSFTYQAFDGRAYSAPAAVRITVTAVNDPPVAAADQYSTGQNAELDVAAPGVLVNDRDADGDPLTVTLVSGPADGTLTLNPDGSFAYAPGPSFRGTDSFTYRVTDPAGASATARVTLRVIPPSGRPVAEDDAYTLDEDTALAAPTPGVLANDTPPGALPLTARLVSPPTHGTLTFNPDGSFTYTPAPDFSGTDSFAYKAVDVNGGSSRAAHVTLTVVASEDPPAAVADQYATTQDTPLVVAPTGVLANDSDPDGDRLTAVLVTGPTHGTLTLNPDGSFTYTPDRGYRGADSFTYRATDGQLASSPVTVTIAVRRVVTPPPEPDPKSPKPPVEPPPTGGPGPVVEPGSGGTPATGGPTPTVGPILPVPVALAGAPAAFGAPGMAAYLVSAPAAPFAPPQQVPTPTIGVPPLPPSPTIPILPAPIRVDVRPTPLVVNPPPAVPDTPAVPAVPVIPPEDPVFSGLDDLKKDLGQLPGVQTVTGTVVGTGVVATAGYVLLSPRLAYWLLSALLARRTVWKPFDPLEVVYAWERENGVGGGEDDSLQGMVDAGSDRPADGHGTTNG